MDDVSCHRSLDYTIRNTEKICEGVYLEFYGAAESHFFFLMLVRTLVRGAITRMAYIGTIC